MEKVKFEEVTKDVVGDAFIDALKTVKPKYKELTNDELAEVLGLTEYQFNHLIGKAISDKVSKAIENKVNEQFLAGNSVEFPNQFNVYVHESEVRKNKNGEPSRKLSIRTRKVMKESLNN